MNRQINIVGHVHGYWGGTELHPAPPSSSQLTSTKSFTGSSLRVQGKKTPINRSRFTPDMETGTTPRVLQGAGYYRVLQGTGGYCRVQGITGYCRVLQGTAGYRVLQGTGYYRVQEGIAGYRVLQGTGHCG